MSTNISVLVLRHVFWDLVTEFLCIIGEARAADVAFVNGLSIIPMS